MLADAADDDVEIILSSAPAEQYEVSFPIGLPDSGFFDGLDISVRELNRVVMSIGSGTGGITGEFANHIRCIVGEDRGELAFIEAGVVEESPEQRLCAKLNFIIPSLGMNDGSS